MKKIRYISVLIAVLLVFLTIFSGCGGKDKDKKHKDTEKSSTGESVKAKGSGSETENDKDDSDSGNFFDNAVFVGDSVTLGLRNYVTSERNSGNECLGEAEFLTAGSMSYSNTLPAIGSENSIHPIYKGTEMFVEDALALIKAKKVFIMLGMNDFCIYSEEEAIGNVKEFINRVKEKNPGIKIYIESVTPALHDTGRFSNENIDKFNAALKTFCGENGCTYVDIASVMKDSNGVLIASYCGDPQEKGVHMTAEGCRVWVNYLDNTFGEGK